MKLISLVLIIFLTSLNVTVGQKSIQGSIDKFSKDPELKHASISFKVVDLKTNTTVAKLNSNLSLPTASITKLFSTATALELLGSDYRPTTRIYYDGYIDSSGVLIGNLWIRGGGDPSLGSKYFNTEINKKQFLQLWTEHIIEHGIKSVEGSIIADASEFGYNGAPDGWSWIDLGNYYGAGPSGLSIYDNLIQFHFRTSGIAGKKSRINSISPEVPGMSFYNYVTSSTKKGDNTYIYGAPYSLERFATGTLPVNSSNFVVKGSLPDPEYQCAFELEKVLKQNAIKVKGGIKSARKMEIQSNDSDYSKRTMIVTHEGEQLIDIINQTNMRSVNLFAEHMISLIGYEKTGNGSTESGLTVLDNYWKTKFDIHGMHVNDGSGLSRTNAISATNFVALLIEMNKSNNSKAFVNSLPVAGVSGTLRSLCKGQTAHNRMHAKSGSMRRIKSYSGYINAISGKKYAFALIVNNYSCSSSTLTRKMEVVFNTIAGN
jgi:D-alanyl-D-alanine carboxypeptidase/D-alanyl-D-alanine-endopeptidase (penicillin-binding protein 4)